MKNEKTSKRVASTAGHLMAVIQSIKSASWYDGKTAVTVYGIHLCTLDQLESVLTEDGPEVLQKPSDAAMRKARLELKAELAAFRKSKYVKKEPVQFEEKKGKRG